MWRKEQLKRNVQDHIEGYNPTYAAEVLGCTEKEARLEVFQGADYRYSIDEITKILGEEQAAKLLESYDYRRIETPIEYKPNMRILERIAAAFPDTNVNDWQRWFGFHGEFTEVDQRQVTNVIGRDLEHVRKLLPIDAELEARRAVWWQEKR